MRKDKCFPFFLVAIIALFLAACGQMELIDEQVSKDERRIEKALQTIAPSEIPKTPLKVDNRPWYGMQAVPISNGLPLPANLNQRDAIVLTFSEPLGMFDVAQMIQSVTGIRIVVGNNVYEDSTAGMLAGRTFLPTGGEEVSGGRIVWSGRLQNLLDQVSDTFGAEWMYDGTMIRFASETTKTFMLHALSSEMVVTGSAGTGSAGTNVPQLDIDGTTTLEIWGEISEAIESMIGEQGEASFSPSTGSITVTARPEVLRRVENYLRYQNQMRLRRVAISVQVLSVRTNDEYTIGTDISGIIKGALSDRLSVVNTSDGVDGLALTVAKNPAGNPSGNISAALTADEGIDRVSVVHSGSLVTLSDQPAPLQVGRQIAYIERVSASSGDGGSASLEPGTVDVGLFMTVLPRIVEGDKILMRLSIAISDAQTPFRNFETDSLRIELPEIETTGFLQNAVVNDGETLVMAGFERSQNTGQIDGTPGGLWTGGTQSTTRARDLTVLLINATILPEEPLTIVGR
jgi:type IVB pilus formation R64 PilN family outer membrane protein